MALSAVKTLSIDRPPARRVGATPLGSPELAGSILDVFVYGSENACLTELFSTERIRQLSDVTPIYLYGPHAVGKSVLATSIAARYSRAHPSTNLMICPGADFARSLAAAIDSDDMDRFRDRFRECSLLVIDGLQELQTKPTSQDEFVLTLDRREAQGMPTIITGLTLPTSMRGLKSALSSRCMGGLSLPIHYPGPEARRRLLTLLAKSLDVRLASNHLHQLADRLTDATSVPELQGLLVKWLHQERLARGATGGESADTLDHLLNAQRQSKMPGIADIAKRVAKELNLRLSDLRGSTRKSQIVRGRSLAMYLARKLTPYSYQQIGEYFGRRDHTTVLHACRKLETDLQEDIDLLRTAEEVQRQLQAT